MANGLGLSREQEEQILRVEAARQADMRARQEVLRALMEDRFGALPNVVLQRIEAATDAERLQASILQVSKISAPDELDL